MNGNVYNCVHGITEDMNAVPTQNRFTEPSFGILKTWPAYKLLYIQCGRAPNHTEWLPNANPITRFFLARDGTQSSVTENHYGRDFNFHPCSRSLIHSLSVHAALTQCLSCSLSPRDRPCFVCSASCTPSRLRAVAGFHRAP